MSDVASLTQVYNNMLLMNNCWQTMCMADCGAHVSIIKLLHLYEVAYYFIV